MLHTQSALPVDPSTADITTGDLKILILDDSDFDLRRVSRMISKVRSDVVITKTKTLEEFQKAFDAQSFDLCMIDHALGAGKTSTDAIEIIKANTAAAKTPAVLVSGLADDTVIAKAVQHGFVSFLDKGTMTVEALKTVISNAVDDAVDRDMRREERRDLVNRVMDDVAQLYSSNTKGHLSKIYNHANFIRQCLAERQFPSPETLDEIEICCFAIWRFLDEAENHGMDVRQRSN